MRTWKALPFLAFAAFIFCGWISEPANSKKIGEKGVLDSGAKYVPVAVDEAAFNELVKARIAKDMAGEMQLIQSGRLFVAISGVKILVIDSRLGRRKVRILEGEHGGRAGWVYVENVR